MSRNFTFQTGVDSRGLILVGVWLLIVLGAVTIAAKDDPKSSPPRSSEPLTTESQSVKEDAGDPHEDDEWSRIREGSKLTDQLGEFQKSADRYSFFQQEGKRVTRVLENLALERVARTLEDDPSPRLWSVTGVLTEYRGENFLLITRAVLKPRAPAKRALDTDKKVAKEA